MIMKRISTLSVICGLLCIYTQAVATPAGRDEEVSLGNGKISLKWQKEAAGWKLSEYGVIDNGRLSGFGKPVGKYCILYSEVKPDGKAVPLEDGESVIQFPEKTYEYVYWKFQRGLSAVAANRAGEAAYFFPENVSTDESGSLKFSRESPLGKYSATWSLVEDHPSDILVKIEFTAAKDGYYSLATPSMAPIGTSDLRWAVVPGYFQGNCLQPEFPLSYAYAQGLPRYPVLCRESTLTTMASIMTDRHGVTMAVIPEPGQDRDPFYGNVNTHDSIWNIALSHMDREHSLSPTAYHPVLGEHGSYLKKGERADFSFVITLSHSDWYDVYKHAVNDIYKFKGFLKLKHSTLSLNDRIFKMLDYASDIKTAMWNFEVFEGDTIAAQSYFSGVSGADNDAMKNSDIGSLYMAANLGVNKCLKDTILPCVANFKKHQQSTEGFTKGAVKGQYYLAKKKEFTEEWGNHVEPVGLTYYTLCDLGNILLFDPENHEMKSLFLNGAERLLKWQKKDGSWEMAYDIGSQKPIFTDLKDFRPTFYGMIVAYRLTGERKYLKSAMKGADWLIRQGADKGYFTGVCGDVRFVNDFSTIQCSSALMELFEITGKEKYKDAAIETARMYTTSIYTHPIPNDELKNHNGRTWREWQISQVGLGFEHGGVMGSAVDHGPILLSSHCSYFLKLYQITGDELFRDMARAGALGREAFVNIDNGTASYYWKDFDKGPGRFPHHAWWQIGWIYDYLVAEAEMRSGGRIHFPRGFMTPKVGPHRVVGHTSGTIDGKKVNLSLDKNLIAVDNPDFDYITAYSEDRDSLYVCLMNNSGTTAVATIDINGLAVYDNVVEVEPFGLAVLRFANKESDTDIFSCRYIRSLMRKVSEWQLEHPKHELNDWTNAVFYSGLSKAWQTTGSPRIFNAMKQMGESIGWQPGKRWYHADYIAIGSPMVDIYRVEHKEDMIRPTIDTLDLYISRPYPVKGWEIVKWWWCDALFMGPPLFVKMGMTTGDSKYLKCNDEYFKECYDLLYNKDEHLFSRALNYVIKGDKDDKYEANGKPIFWSRGNGWVVAGLAQILDELPADYQKRPFYENLMKEMLQRIVELQPSDGLWRTSLLNPESYPHGEVSGSSLFCYALAWAINNGLVDRATYLPVVMRTWGALGKCIDDEGKIGWVQPIGANPQRNFNADSWEVYGTGAFLLAASEVYKLQAGSMARSRLVAYVNPLMGTFSRMELSAGHTYPAVCLPYAMHNWSPYTGKTGDRFLYTYQNNFLYGFRQTHQASLWIGDYGQFSLMPVISRSQFSEERRKSWYSHKTEVSKPHYYSVYLGDHQTDVEMTATERAAKFRIDYRSNDSTFLVVDAFDQGSFIQIFPEERKLIGYSSTLAGGAPDNFKNYFVMRFDRPIVEASVWSGDTLYSDRKCIEGEHVGGLLRFDIPKGEKLNVDVSSSYIDHEQAFVNLRRELGDKSFEEIKTAAEKIWETELGKIKVSEESYENCRTFYTCLYRTLIFPRKFYEIDRNGNIVHYSPYTGKVHSGYMYADNGFWDTFRAQFPLMNLLSPDIVSEFLMSLENIYKESGWVPEWISPGMRDCMIGSHATSIIADARNKNIHGPDYGLLYEAMLKSASGHGKDMPVGRLGYESYNSMGYIPYDAGINQDVSRTLEYAFNDYCIAVLGRSLGRPRRELDTFLGRSHNYRNLFNPSYGLMCPKGKNGNFQPDFDPLRWGDHFTEGNSWQYSWFVPHDVEGLSMLHGGLDKMFLKMDSVFTMRQDYDISYYKRGIIHLIREMQSADMGQYAHLNEPMHHMIYMYGFGQPWKTQYWSRKIMDRLYAATPDGYCGDEDNGQMSAWYVFSALGFYPLCPASNQYVFGSPLFRHAEMTLGNGCKVTISAPDNSPENVYVNSITVDGEDYDRNFITYEMLGNGTDIKFEMSAKPERSRGISAADRPFSLSSRQ